MTQLPVPVVTIGLLIASNIFMTFAWYGHLKYKTASLVLARSRLSLLPPVRALVAALASLSAATRSRAGASI